MKNRSVWPAVLACLLTSVGVAGAQYPYSPYGAPQGTPPARPSPVSPYLNLLRNGNSPAFNYTTLVRPALEFQKDLRGLQNQVFSVQQAMANPQQAPAGPTTLPVTGQPVGFQTHKSYFMNFGGMATAPPVAGAGGATVNPLAAAPTKR